MLAEYAEVCRQEAKPCRSMPAASGLPVTNEVAHGSIPLTCGGTEPARWKLIAGYDPNVQQRGAASPGVGARLSSREANCARVPSTAPDVR